MNELYFTMGKGGKSGAFIRVVSNTEGEPAPITIGKRYVYGSQKASDFENKIMSLGNIVAAFQRLYVEKKLGGHDYIVTFHVNLIHTVVASIKSLVPGSL